MSITFKTSWNSFRHVARIVVYINTKGSILSDLDCVIMDGERENLTHARMVL